MLRMKDAIRQIDSCLTGEPEAENTQTASAPEEVLPLKKQLENVVSKSERTSLEQVLYDMLLKKRPQTQCVSLKLPRRPMVLC